MLSGRQALDYGSPPGRLWQAGKSDYHDGPATRPLVPLCTVGWSCVTYGEAIWL